MVLESECFYILDDIARLRIENGYKHKLEKFKAPYVLILRRQLESWRN